MTETRHADLERFAAAIVSRLGFQMHPHNEGQVAEAMRHALARTGCRSIKEYLERCRDAAFAQGELREVAMELTVPETYFFRHSEQFQAFLQVAVPDRVKARGAVHALRVLSAGCSSGEEAYSLAAALFDVPALQGWDLGVWGVDVNPRLLDKARLGRYLPWSLRGVSEAARRRHFRAEGETYHLNDKLRSAVRFEARNLLDDDPQFWQADFFDAIFCRNVMIYFSPAAMRDLVGRLTRSLAPGGFLFLGPSETLRGLTDAFHLRHTHEAFYYQRRMAHEPAPLAAWGATAPSPMEAAPPEADKGTWISAIAGASGRIAALADQAHRPPGPRGPAVAPAGTAFPAEQDLGEVRGFLRQERFDDALKAISALPQGAAADSDAMLLQAVVRANTGDLSGAEQVCGQLLARDEMRPGAHYLMAVCQERRGDRLSAAEHDQAAIYLEPAFAMPHLHLGLLAKRLGDAATARRELEEARALLGQEEASRILLFGGGFTREALIRFCEAQLERCGESG